ncbi:hypothetical protein [Rhodococcus sp. H29-C3]|uniref:hypothetical protein n=1 Tax=Rhodococcus sp. H29-C3 TaxID=3046307 RepID=UPI0024B917BE|nr:hypothetical protein [Rhodococcus sp. H29-C3]MDJ0360013.1 hypothetical protein [Rhodococcus sp. H29-C3]
MLVIANETFIDRVVLALLDTVEALVNNAGPDWSSYALEIDSAPKGIDHGVEVRVTSFLSQAPFVRLGPTSIFLPAVVVA